MAGHAAGNGMDGVFHLDAFLLEPVGHFAQGMLRLRHRHAVAGHDDHLAGILHDEGRVLGGALLHRPLFLAGRRSRDLAAEPAENHRNEAAVHALAHDVGQDRAGRADQRPGDDERRIPEREADPRGGPAGIGIEHGNDDRHVGAADRDDDEHAEGERGQRQEPEREMTFRAHEPYDQRDDQHREPDIDGVAGGQKDGRAAHASGQFQERDHRAGEGHRADGNADRHLDQARLVDRTGGADIESGGCIERSRRHQHRRHADQRMERGHQLRHRGHGHAAGNDGAGAAADGEAEDDEHPGAGPERRMVGKRRDDGDRHADHAEQVALPAGFRIR